MTLTVADDPPDRLRWVSETIRPLADGTDEWRAQLLARVEQASDADLARDRTTTGASVRSPSTS